MSSISLHLSSPFILQTTPPIYNATTMEVPVVLFTGNKDWLADPTDVAQLTPDLKTIVNTYNYPTYNHMDFVWGMDVAPTIYQKIVDYIKNDTSTSHGRTH